MIDVDAYIKGFFAMPPPAADTTRVELAQKLSTTGAILQKNNRFLVHEFVICDFNRTAKSLIY